MLHEILYHVCVYMLIKSFKRSKSFCYVLQFQRMAGGITPRPRVGRAYAASTAQWYVAINLTLVSPYFPSTIVKMVQCMVS